MRSCISRLCSLAALSGACAAPAEAQGIASAALEGRVVQASAGPIEGVVVRVTSTGSGTAWQVATDRAGRYFIENVEVGGPYAIELRRIGFAPARRAGIVLALGQRYRADFVLEPAVTSLGAMTVTVSADSLLNSGRMGPEHVISEEALARIPNQSRDLSAAAILSPLVVARPLGGVSIAGQNQGFNSLQIDGGVSADVYLGRSPGGASPSGALPEVLPHAISLEAVEEFQLLPAPFDVRFGNFAGGLLNAVTKSGGNDFGGSVFAFVQDGNLVGRTTLGRRSDFTSSQFGGTVAGPLVRNRVHFFLNADVQRRIVPDPGPLVTDSGRTFVTEASAREFRDILDSVYGFDGGALSSTGHLPAQDLFGKLSFHLGATGRLEMSHHYAHARRSGFVDVGRTLDTTALASVAGTSRSTAHISRLIWNAVIRDRTQSEVIVSYQRLRDSCDPDANFPLIQVKADGGTLIAGPNSVCPTTDVRQSALQLTGNLTIGRGHHLLTLGSHGELLHFRDPLVQVSEGRWDFPSLAALRAGRATHYDRGLPAPPPRRPGADFHVVNLGVYAQDRWTPTDRLTLTGGLRAEVPLLPDEARTNPALLGRGIDTGRLPGGTPSWSPRFGVNYDLLGDGTAFMRGGLGVFTGPPPYRWLGNGYRDSGDERLVSCDGPNTPVFAAPFRPEQCLDGQGVSPRIGYFDSEFKLPRNLKVALGGDRRFAGGFVGTVDVLYTYAIDQFYVTQANLDSGTGVAAREGRRRLYGRFDAATGLLRPAWRDTADQTKEIYRLTNQSGDNALSVSGQVRKQFSDLLGIQGSYTRSRVRDRMSIVNFPARANFSNSPVDGTLEERRLRNSFFETPHKIVVLATLGRPQRTQLTLVYAGASQPPFTYVVSGDANGDGIGGSGSLKNDIVYVPMDSADIMLAAPADFARLDSFIERQPCLRNQRGRIMARGSCRNGWLDFLNARLTTTRVSPRGGVELTLDVFNVPNLINSRWGRHHDITAGPSVILLSTDRWVPDSGRWQYKVPKLPGRGIVDDQSSRWRMQVGARYVWK